MDEVRPEQRSASGVKAAAGELLRAYRAIDKVDRWSGGGQTLALVVKVFGWVGLLCVLWVLVVKLNDVARSLDPVKNGIARLASQLEQSRAAIAAEDARRREDSQRLSAAAGQLAESTQRLQRAATAVSVAQTDAAQAAADGAKELRETAEKLRAQANDDAAAQAVFLKTLDDASQSAGRARDAIAKAGTDVDQSGNEAVAAARRASSELENLRLAVAGIDVGPLKSSVSRAGLAAQELSAALEKAASEQQRTRAVVASDHQK